VQVTVILWVAANVAWVVLSQGGFAFLFPDTPTTVVYWLVNNVLGIALPQVLIAITIALTRSNAFPTAKFLSRARLPGGFKSRAPDQNLI
jgi:hypothetical protein